MKKFISILLFLICRLSFANNTVLVFLEKNKSGKDEVYKQLSRIQEGKDLYFLYYGEYEFNAKNGKPDQGEYIILKLDEQNIVTRIVRDQSFTYNDKRFTQQINDRFFHAKLKHEHTGNPDFLPHLKKRCALKKCNALEEKFILEN
jgi:hypothetical protein